MTEWKIHQDSPEFGCDDNPSYEWYVNEYRNGHWTGGYLKAPDEELLLQLKVFDHAS